DSTVTVPNATLKTGSSWTDKGDGTYTATYTATTAGTGLKATVKLSGWAGPATSEAYAITLEDEAPASINTQANAYTFTQTSEEGTFPTTGFTSATFTIVPKDSKKATDYNWTSDASWVSVTDGVVKFTGTGTGSKVTITGTPTSGQGKIIKYSFTLKSWFISNRDNEMSWSAAVAYCTKQSGYSLPTVRQLIGNSSYYGAPRGTLGGLWSEWGDVLAYSLPGFTGVNYWSSELRSSGHPYDVNLNNGYVVFDSNDYDDDDTGYVVCRQGL
ncbi:invasin, partial [Enterobacter cancerogenus]